MATCTPYIDCENTGESWESLFKRLVVEQADGSLAIRTICCEPTPVIPDLTVTCPDSVVIPASQTQEYINGEFATWIAGFGYTGGCEPVTTTPLGGYVAPDTLTGGVVSITYTADDSCSQTAECTSTFTVEAPPPVLLALELTWDSIANVPVSDAASVANWNTFFNLPTNGTPFTSITVVGNVVKLYGGAGITVSDYLFLNNIHLVSIVDNALCITTAGGSCFNGCPSLASANLGALITAGGGCFYNCPSLATTNLSALITAGDSCFYNCTSLTSANLGALITSGNYCFQNCNSLTIINLSSCTNLGPTTGNDGVFNGITGLTITLTCDASLLTCDGGAPDGDLCYLHNNNTITVNGAPLAGCP